MPPYFRIECQRSSYIWRVTFSQFFFIKNTNQTLCQKLIKYCCFIIFPFLYVLLISRLFLMVFGTNYILILATFFSMTLFLFRKSHHYPLWNNLQITLNSLHLSIPLELVVITTKISKTILSMKRKSWYFTNISLIQNRMQSCRFVCFRRKYHGTTSSGLVSSCLFYNLTKCWLTT